MTIHTKPLRASSQRRLSRWAKALRNRHVSAFHWRIVGDERLRASIDRRFDAEFRRGNLPGDVLEIIERELGHGVEYRLAELACRRIEETDAYRERLQALEAAYWRTILNKSWSQSLISLTDAVYWIATSGEPREPEDDELETAASELVARLQSGDLVACGIPGEERFHEDMPIEHILTATRDGAPIFGESVFGDAPRLLWAITPGEDGDTIEDRNDAHWRGVSIKKSDLMRLWPAKQETDEGLPLIEDVPEQADAGTPATVRRPTRKAKIVTTLQKLYPIESTMQDKALRVCP